MAHYDPLRNLDELDEPTVAALVDRYDVEELLEGETNAADVQAHLAGALNEIGPQTMDDTAKWHAVRSIIAAMQAIDDITGQTTELAVETVEETTHPEWADDPQTIEYDQPSVRCRPSGD